MTHRQTTQLPPCLFSCSSCLLPEPERSSDPEPAESWFWDVPAGAAQPRSHLHTLLPQAGGGRRQALHAPRGGRHLTAFSGPQRLARPRCPTAAPATWSALPTRPLPVSRRQSTGVTFGVRHPWEAVTSLLSVCSSLRV